MSRAAATASTSDAFSLKGGSFTGTVLELQTTALEAIRAQLAARTLDSAAWLQQSPVILQLDKVADEPGDWPAIVTLCREQGVSVIGIRAPRSLHEALQGVGVPVLAALRAKVAEAPPPEPAAVAPAAAASPVAATSARPTRVITQPVRGGQQVYADGDLIILAAVSAGAEVLAEGHIHLYGPLRGRALAGVSGNAEARIFCQSLEAELISVAGRYRVAEELRQAPEWGKPVQVALDGDRLNLTTL